MPFLQFKAADVRRVVEHTLAAPKQSKTWKPGGRSDHRALRPAGA
jgi:hypothetical protein